MVRCITLRGDRMRMGGISYELHAGRVVYETAGKEPCMLEWNDFFVRGAESFEPVG